MLSFWLLLPALTVEADEAVWVFFTDRGPNPTVSAEISPRARARRAKMDLPAAPLVVDFEVDPGYLRRLEALGCRIRTTSRWLNAASVAAPRAALERLSELSLVRSYRHVARRLPGARPDRVVKREARAARGDFHGELGAFFRRVGIAQLQAQGLSGSGVWVAVLDSGFRVSHEAFAASSIAATYDFVFDDPIVQNQPEDVPSAHDHGTSVLSVLAANLPFTLVGAAPGASLLLAKSEDVRSETPVEEDYWVAALEWAEAQGADVVSSSVGYIDWYDAGDLDGQHAVTSIAANQAAALGVVVVNAIGNRAFGPKPILAPADAPGVLSIGATTLDAVITFFSSRGPTVDGRIKPDACAIGSNVPVAAGDWDSAYGLATGTSFAAPMVAGAAALLLQAHPDWTPAMVFQALRESADHQDLPDPHYGWGLIDAAASSTFAPKPELGLVRATVQEPGNGALDPGETAPLTIALRNAGGVGAAGLNVQVQPAAAAAPLLPFPDLASGETVEALAGTVSAPAGAPCGAPLRHRIEVTGAGGFSAALPLALRAGWPLDRPALWSDDFESDSGQWNPLAGPGPVHWQRNNLLPYAHSGSYTYFAPAANAVNLAALESAAVELPAAQEILLEFWHTYQMEATFDGGVLELAVDGGPWLDAGARLLEGGYNVRLDDRFDNPLGGRPSWSGNTLPEFSRVRADLSDLAGHEVQVRFSAGSDAAVEWVGWLIDDVRIRIGGYDCGDLGLLSLGPAGAGAAPVRRARRASD